MGCCKTQNICMFQGDDLRVIISVYDTLDSPVDITGAQSIIWKLAQSTDDVALITKSLGAGITINNPTSFYFDIESYETQTLFGQYYHEAEIITDQGLKYTGISGHVTIKKTLIK